MDLDAERSRLLGQLRNAVRRFDCVQVVGGRQQGKTLLLARLAHELAQVHGHIYWCSAAYRKGVLGKVQIVSEYLATLSHWAWKPRVYILLDDVLDPEEDIAGLRSVEHDADVFARALQGKSVTLVVSGVRDVFANISADASLSVSLEERDVDGIVRKWQEHGVISAVDATSFLDESTNQNLYRRRLFALLALLYDHAAASYARSQTGSNHLFLRKFEDSYESFIGDVKHDVTMNLLPIAACQLIDIAVPRRLVAAIDRDFQMNHSIVTQSSWSGDGDDVVYEMGGPFLARWLLKQKLAKDDFEQLLPPFELMLEKAFSIDNFGYFASERAFVPSLLDALACGLSEDLFQGRSRDVARMLLKGVRPALQGFYETVKRRARMTELIDWGNMFKRLSAWDLAGRAYEAALDSLSRDSSPRDRLRLIIGLASLPQRHYRAKVVPIVENEIKQTAAAGTGPMQALCQLLHVLCNTLQGLDKWKDAIDAWKTYCESGIVKPDAVLYLQLGTLYDKGGMGSVEQAQESFDKAVQDAPSNSATLVHCLQRYAIFLAEHPTPTWPRPHALFRQALVTARSSGLTVEGIVDAWAEYQESIGYYDRARRHFEHSITSLRKRGIVQAHAWQGLATLLRDHYSDLKGDPTNHLANAERLCHEVLEDEFVGWTSKMYAAHILGRLVGDPPAKYEYDNHRRPNLNEAVEILQYSFESPAGLRDDPIEKTFQDLITHRVLKDVYSRALRDHSEAAETNAMHLDTRARDLAQLVERHGRGAFHGFPRGDTPDIKTLEHVLLARDWFAFFLQHDRPLYFPELIDDGTAEADKLYRSNLHDLSYYKLGRDAQQPWRLAVVLYLHYARFRTIFFPIDDAIVMDLANAAAKCLLLTKLPAFFRKEIRDQVLAVSTYMWFRAYGVVQKSPCWALKLDESVIALEEAWIEQSPDDREVHEKLDGAISVTRNLKRDMRQRAREDHRWRRGRN